MQVEHLTRCGGSAFLCPACGQFNAPGLLHCLHCFAIYCYDDGEGNAVSPIASKAYHITVQGVRVMCELPDEEMPGAVQEDVPPVPTGEGKPITGLGDPDRIATYGTCTHAGSPLRVLMRTMNSHYFHAWSWRNLYSAEERAAGAAHGVQPLFSWGVHRSTRGLETELLRSYSLTSFGWSW